jgi:hypothetical protein
MNQIIEKLQGGDLRSKGRSDEVVKEVFDNPRLFGLVVDGMIYDDPVVRMRASDALEKITKKRPEFLAPHKSRLIIMVSQIDQQEVRWHMALILPRLQLTEQEREKVFEILLSYLEDKSKIVKTFAMQGLADIAEQDRTYLTRVVGLMKDLIETGSPAMKNRGKKLLAHLEAL